jgi:hypothetical protein
MICEREGTERFQRDAIWRGEDCHAIKKKLSGISQQIIDNREDRA